MKGWTRRWWGSVAIGTVMLVASALVTGSSGTEPEEKAPQEKTLFPGAKPVFSADRLGSKWGEGSVFDMLEPEERQALRDTNMDWADDNGPVADDPPPPPEAAAPRGKWERRMDAVGNVGLSVLGVGLTLGMMAAPYLLM